MDGQADTYALTKQHCLLTGLYLIEYLALHPLSSLTRLPYSIDAQIE